MSAGCACRSPSYRASSAMPRSRHWRERLDFACLRANVQRSRTALERPMMFIQTEPTPNPATLKFLPGRTVIASGTLDMRDKEAAAQSPLAERLFGVAGVSGVFFGSDFIAVTKGAGEWQQLK